MACCSSNDGLIPENEGLRGILRRKKVNLSNNNSNIGRTVAVSTVKIGSVGLSLVIIFVAGKASFPNLLIILNRTECH